MRGVGFGPHAEQAILGMQHDLAVGRQVVRHQRRQTDAEIDIGALGNVARDPRRQLLAIELLHASPPRNCWWR